MSKTYQFLVLLSFFSFCNAQEKDSIYGNVKSIREKVEFLNDTIQNRKLFSFEGDYGHNGFNSPRYNQSRFHSWWYTTYWSHYVNYFKAFDESGKPLEETWFYKNQDTVYHDQFNYNKLGKLKNQIKIEYGTKSNITYSYNENAYLESVNTIKADTLYASKKYFFNDKNLVTEIEYFNSFIPDKTEKTLKFYDDEGNLLRMKKIGFFSSKFGTIYEFDKKGRKSKVFNQVSSNSLIIPDPITQNREDKGIKQLSEQFFYDEKDRIIETHYYKQDFNDRTKVVLYRKIKNIYKDDLLIKIIHYKNADSIISTKTYKYDEKGRVIKNTTSFSKHSKNNRTLQYSYANHNLPTKLIYEDDRGKTEVEFVHEFDENKNWIKQTKSVNGEKLYVWTREITYFK